MRLLIPILVLTSLTACAGEFEMTANGEEVTEWTENGPVTASNDPSSTDPSNPDDVVVEPLTPAFELPRDTVRLLPFHIRVSKLSSATGVPSTDPLFDQIWASRYDLGDHNYAQGVGADLSWNATKMSLWVRALQPICASEAFAMRYGSLPADVEVLIENAFGRPATAEDLADYRDAAELEVLDDAGRYEAVCLAVLSSTEFVAQ